MYSSVRGLVNTTDGTPQLAVVSHNVVAEKDGRWLIKNRIGEIVDRLPDCGWRVRLISRRSDELPFLTHTLSRSVEVIAFDGSAAPSKRARQLAAVLRTLRSADRVLVFMPSLFSGMLALCVGRRAVVYAGASWALREGTPGWRKWLEAAVARRAAEVIVPGDALLARFEPVARRASLCVPLVRDEICERMRSAAREVEVHRPLRLLFVGSIRRDKGVAELADAVAEMDGVTCRLVGPMQEDPFAERLVARVEQLPGVQLVGYLDWRDLRATYEWADVLVLPSHTEGFPRVACEATAFGVALIVTPVGGLPDRFESGRDALFIPIGDPEGTRRAVQSLVAAPARIPPLVRNAHSRLAPLFRHANPVAQFDEALRAVPIRRGKAGRLVQPSAPPR